MSILNIKDKFTFLSDKNSSKLIKCEYILNIDTVTSNVSFLFDLNSSVIKDFYLEKIRYNQE